MRGESTLLDVPHAARRARVCEATIYRLRRAGRLNGVMVGRRLHFERDGVDALPRCPHDGCGETAGPLGSCKGHARAVAQTRRGGRAQRLSLADPYFTVDEAASHVGETSSSIYTRIARGELVPLRMRGRRWFRRSWLDAFLERRERELTLSQTAEVFGHPFEALRWEVFKSRRIPSVTLGGQGAACILDKAVTRTVLKRCFPRCDVVDCARPLLGPTGGCGVRGHWRQGRPRPELQKYGRASECHDCEDCGTSLAPVKGARLVEVAVFLCMSCAQKQRWREPDDALKRWLENTEAYRAKVKAELERLRGDGWLTVKDLASRVDRAPAIVTERVREAKIPVTRHALIDGQLVAVSAGQDVAPVWFLFSEEQAQACETWLQGGDYRRQQPHNREWRALWYRRRFDSMAWFTRLGVTAEIAARRGKRMGRKPALTSPELALAVKLRRAGWGWRPIAEKFNSLRKPEEAVSHMAVKRAVSRQSATSV